MTDYNFELCEARHQGLGESLREIKGRLSKVENRFLALITGILLNLLGVVGTLIILLTKS